jgi:oxygen-dependent protoporphyrinogen oxidase
VAPRASGVFVLTPTGLVAYPTGTAFGIPGDLGDAFRWPGVSRAGRARALGDLLIRTRRVDADESLGGLLRRRLGDEATDRSLAPLLGALYAGDVDELSVRATFPELAAFERAQGSLLRGAQVASRNGRRNPGGPMYLQPRGGIDRLPEALAERVGGSLRTGVQVTGIAHDGEDWRLTTPNGTVEADAVVLTQDAPGIATLLPPGRAAELLADIPSVSTGSVLLVYGEGTAAELPDGSGFVAPRGSAPMYACTWLSQRWPDPATGGRAVLSCAVGGVGAEDLLDAPDDDLVDACARHLTALLPLPSRPDHAAVVRWPGSTPQYQVGHPDRVREIREVLPAGIVVAGRSLDGVDVSDEVRSADASVEALLDRFAEEVHR